MIFVRQGLRKYKYKDKYKDNYKYNYKDNDKDKDKDIDKDKDLILSTEMLAEEKTRSSDVSWNSS